MSLKNKAEALLFSGGKAMDEEQIAALNDVEVKDVRKALKELQKDYAERDTSLKLYNEGSSWKLLVKDEHIDLVRRIVADTELSRATLETLAIIAYNQPTVLQSKVVDLRGGNAYEHIKELVELGFVTKNKEGRSYALRLTEKFFEYFDVEGGDNIKQVFKGVKPPKERQKQLGGLQVIDELPLTAKQTKDKEDAALLGGLAVVDELPEKPEMELDDNGVPEAPGRLEETDEEKEVNSDFLAKLENQIDNLSKKNDERDEDEDFKSSASEEAAEGEEAEEGAEPAGEESPEEASGTEEEPPAEETPSTEEETTTEETPEPEPAEETETIDASELPALETTGETKRPSRSLDDIEEEAAEEATEDPEKSNPEI